MPLKPPNLDDRRFADLFEEMKALIPRYAPEWTDHNLSDPGITLMQLFAWLGEMTLYRLNRVPDRNYIKFLQLIGVEQKPAIPAKAEVTFTLATRHRGSVIIPRGTQIRAEAPPPPPSVVDAPQLLSPEREEPIVFETDEPLVVLGATLASVQVDMSGGYTDCTEANRTMGDRYPAFGSEPSENNALLLGLTSNSPFPTDEINLTVRLYRDPTDQRPHCCELPTTQAPPPATVAWEYWTGSQWKLLKLLKDETRALTQSGHVYFQGPGKITQATLGLSLPEPLYWIRCRLVRSQYERPPVLDAVLINTVRATAVTTVRDEVLGASNGLPHQRLRLRRSPLYARAVRPVEERLQEQAHQRVLVTAADRQQFDETLRERELRKGFLLEVDEGQGDRPWEEVDDFFNSSADDRHYILNRTTGDVHFGDGEQGRIPLAGINNIVARYYRYGGGARTNVGAGTLTDLQTYVAGVETVTNLWPAAGGADEEPIADTKARAPKELKARDRAVTSQDFEFLARQVPGVWVRRAHALPLYHPQFPTIEVPGVVTVIVVPEGDKAMNWPPMPSESTLQAVCEYLNQRRLLTTELIVMPPNYLRIGVEATVVVQGAADPARVKTDVERALTRFLDPLEGGEDGQGWPLGGTVFYSEVFQQMLRVEGVDRIEDLHLLVDGDRLGKCVNAEIPRDYLVFSKEHEIDVRFSASI